LAAGCPPYEPSDYCCLASKITVSPAGQYPRYIQYSSGTFGGTTEGCGYGCITGGVGECGGDHTWGCSTSQGGLITGAVTYTSNLQMTPESGCVLPRVSEAVNYSILVDIAKPQGTISFPESGAIVKSDDMITGEATDDYQLWAISAGSQYYSFLGDLPRQDDGGYLYYDRADSRNASWELPVSAVGRCVDTLQEITLNLYDAVGNTEEIKHSIYVDCSVPLVTIDEPSTYANAWSDPTRPVIRGYASDDIGIAKMWLVIRDMDADRYWNGSGWQAGAAIISVVAPVGKTGSWEYIGLTKNDLRSGRFAIKAYAKDKVDRVGMAQVTVGYTKRLYLGKMDFTSYTIHAKDIRNIARSEDTNSFITKTGEDVIGVSAEITPYRITGTLSPYVKWDVFGANGVSGNPVPALVGNPSRFYTRIPPIPVYKDGRGAPLSYTAFPRLEYEYEGETQKYHSPSWKTISQDNLDTLRQEYVDLATTYSLPRTSFDMDLPAFPGLLVSPGFETSRHDWHILKYLNSKAIALGNAVGPFGVILRPNSGYRCPIGNKDPNVGGEYNSIHMLGRALDYQQEGINSSNDNWTVWKQSQNQGATEYLLYDQLNCRVNNGDLSAYTEFKLPIMINVKCPKQNEFLRRVTSYRHGHAGW